MGTATAEPTVLDGLKDDRNKVSAEWDELIEGREKERQEFEARLAETLHSLIQDAALRRAMSEA
jgi:hypothetical protein